MPGPLRISSDSRVIHPLWRATHELYVVLVPAPPSSPEDDPLIVVGSSWYLTLELATAAWTAAYPDETGAIEVYHVPLAMAALAGRVMEDGYGGIGHVPIDDRYRLVAAKLVPLPELPPVEEWVAIPRWPGPYARLLHQFFESGLPHARVEVTGKRLRGLRSRLNSAGILAYRLCRAARLQDLPVKAVARKEDVYISRTDLEAPTVFEGEGA